MTYRKHLPHGTLVGAHPHVKTLWYQRDLEPELLSDEPIPEPSDELDPLRERDAKVLVSTLLERCTPQEARVLTMRYMEDMTLQEIGQVLGVTRERIRQVERKALLRLKAFVWRKTNQNMWSFFS